MEWRNLFLKEGKVRSPIRWTFQGHRPRREGSLPVRAARGVELFPQHLPHVAVEEVYGR